MSLHILEGYPRVLICLLRTFVAGYQTDESIVHMCGTSAK